jgi:hypothetical protein
MSSPPPPSRQLVSPANWNMQQTIVALVFVAIFVGIVYMASSALGGSGFAMWAAGILGVLAYGQIIAYKLFPEVVSGFNTVVIGEFFLLGLVVPLVIASTFMFSFWIPLFALPFYVMFMTATKPTAGVTALLILLVVIVGYWQLGLVSFTPESPLGKAFNAQEVAMSTLYQRITGLAEEVPRQIQTQISKASGTYYESKVDESQNRQLGVRVDPLRITATRVDAPIYVSSSVTAGLINDPVTVNYACAIGDRPADEYVGSDQAIEFAISGQQGVSCVFNPSTLKEGTHTVNLLAEYDFIASSYLEAYFIDEARLRSMNLNPDVDLKAELGVNPRSGRSSGPVMFGMGTSSSQPFILRENKDSEFQVGITIDKGGSSWATSGEVTDIRNMYIILPRELSVSRVLGGSVETGTCADLPTEDASACDELGLVPYFIKLEKSKGKFSLLPSALPHTIDLFLKSDTAGRDSLLGPSRFSSKLLRVGVDYSYQIKQVGVVRLSKSIAESNAAKAAATGGLI